MDSLSIELDSELLVQAEEVCAEMGITVEDAVVMFLQETRLEGRLQGHRSSQYTAGVTAECDRYAPPAELSICRRPHFFQLPQPPAQLAKIQEISFTARLFF